MKTRFLNYSKRVFSTTYSSLFKYSDPSNPKVFLTVAKDNHEIGKLVFELYKKNCPKSVDNFLKICSGQNDDKLSYKNTVFNKIINGYALQGGNIVDEHEDERSIYSRNFPDENLKLKHTKRGTLSLDNHGPDTNSSKFIVTFTETPWLDGYHVVIGELVEGEKVLSEIEAYGTRDGKPKAEIKVVDCGNLL